MSDYLAIYRGAPCGAATQDNEHGGLCRRCAAAGEAQFERSKGRRDSQVRFIFSWRTRLSAALCKGGDVVTGS
jgi:hypothetical protein